MKHRSNVSMFSSPGGDADGPGSGWGGRAGTDAEPGDGHAAEAASASRGNCTTCGRLTSRERWVVTQVMKHKGAPNKVLASAMKISPNTLRNHLASIYGKLGVRRRVELVLYAMEHGLDRSVHS